MKRKTTKHKTLTMTNQVTLRYTVVEDDQTYDKEWFTSRAQRRFETQPRWKCYRELDWSGDRLAYRAFLLQAEGRETVQNAICQDHGLPNRW